MLQTSKNFLEPSQLTYYNDMVEIAGDAALHDAYVKYLLDMKAQVRSDDHYFVRLRRRRPQHDVPVAAARSRTATRTTRSSTA